jgi:hypothetical protein
MAWIDDDVTPSWNRVPAGQLRRGISPGGTAAVRHDTEQLQRSGEVATGHLQRLANDPVHPGGAKPPADAAVWQHRSRQHGRRYGPPGAAWSTFGPHATGAERFVAVCNGASFAQVAGVILYKQARGRTLIRMRSRCHLSAGRPATEASP